MTGNWWSACIGGCLGGGATAGPSPGAAPSSQEGHRSSGADKQDKPSDNAVQQDLTHPAATREVSQKATTGHHSAQKLNTACNCGIPSLKATSELEAGATQPGLTSPSPLTSADNHHDFQAPCRISGDRRDHASAEPAAPVAAPSRPCDTSTSATQSCHTTELKAPPLRDSGDGCSERPDMASALANITQASCADPGLSSGMHEVAAPLSPGDQAAQDLVQYVQADIHGAKPTRTAAPGVPTQAPGVAASTGPGKAGTVSPSLPVATPHPSSILRHRTPSGRSFSAPSNPLRLSPLGSQQLPPQQQQGPSGRFHIHPPSTPDFFTAASKLMRWATEYEDCGKGEGAGVGAGSLLWTERTCRTAGNTGGNSSLSGRLSSRMSSKLSSKLSGRPSGSLTASSLASRGSSRELPEQQLVSAGSGALSLPQLGMAKHPHTHTHPRGARPAPSSHHDWAGVDPGELSSLPLAMVPENTLHGAGAEPAPPPVTLPLSSHFPGPAAQEAAMRFSGSGSQLPQRCSSPRLHACSCGQCGACAAAADGGAPSCLVGGSGSLHRILPRAPGSACPGTQTQGYVGVVTSPTLSRWGLMLSKAAEQQLQTLPLRRLSREPIVRSHSHVPADKAAAAAAAQMGPGASAQAAAARRVSVEEQRVQRSLSHSHQ